MKAAEISGAKWLEQFPTVYQPSSDCGSFRSQAVTGFKITPNDVDKLIADAYEKGIRDAAEVARKTYAGWEWNFMYQDASQTIGNDIESLLTKPKDKDETRR